MFISFLRTVVLYLVIVVTLRIMGKRQVGELEPSELVVAILISDLAAVPMQDIGIPLLSGIIPIVTLLALELLLSQWAMESLRFRSLLCGKPVFIIREGIIDQKAMTDNRLTLDELLFCLRQQQILDISRVQYAILETNGQLTAFPYPKYSPMTPETAGKPVQKGDYPITVINDGRILTENLNETGHTVEFLYRKLRAKGITPEDVFFMALSRNGTSTVIRKEQLP